MKGLIGVLVENVCEFFAKKFKKKEEPKAVAPTTIQEVRRVEEDRVSQNVQHFYNHSTGIINQGDFANNTNIIRTVNNNYGTVHKVGSIKAKNVAFGNINKTIIYNK